MSDLEQLIAQAQKLNRQIAELRTAQRAQAIAEIQQLMAQHGLTVEHLTNATKATGPKKMRVAAKYLDGQGNSWTGRGLKPRWLIAALGDGKVLEDFTV